MQTKLSKTNKPNTILVALHGDSECSWLSVETLNRRYHCALSGDAGRCRKLVSRYYALTKAQLIRFSRQLQRVRSESTGKACALWAANALDALVGSHTVHFVDFSASHDLGRELILREMRQPTSRFRPAACSG